MASMNLLYKVDNWHSTESKELLGIFYTKENAILHAQKHAKLVGEVISKDDLYLLDTVGQTQAFDDEGEYMIEEVKINELIS
jgi:hypothetical protein